MNDIAYRRVVAEVLGRGHEQPSRHAQTIASLQDALAAQTKTIESQRQTIELQRTTITTLRTVVTALTATGA